MRPLRIALLHFTALPVVGGVERVVNEHARLIAAAGHEVVVLAGRGRATRGRPAFRRLALADPRHPRVVAAQRALCAGSVPEAFGRLVDDLVAALRAEADAADVLIAHNVCSLPLNLALTAALHVASQEPRFPKVVAWQHDLGWSAPRYRAQLHDGEPWDLIRTAWPGVTTVTISEQRRAEWAALSGTLPASTTVIPNGFDRLDRLGIQARTRRILDQPGLAGSGPLFLSPVRVTPRKNLELAIRILAAVRRSSPGAQLIVSGPLDPHDPRAEAHLRDLRSLTHALGVDAAVHFLGTSRGGAPSDQTMRDLFLVADALLITSSDEGFGLPILEAAAARLPIFCHDLPSLRELAGPDATYLDPSADPVVSARLIARRLRGDRAYRVATRLRRRYSWDAVYANHLAPLLAGLLGGPTAPTA
ncbi:MAG: glycosyltransferase family 4 protein [Chloroflexi bacterium]|nr:glycosyltransferase family 4 protein [Chloroflexota bacterium]